MDKGFWAILVWARNWPERSKVIPQNAVLSLVLQFPPNLFYYTLHTLGNLCFTNFSCSWVWLGGCINSHPTKWRYQERYTHLPLVWPLHTLQFIGESIVYNKIFDNVVIKWSSLHFSFNLRTDVFLLLNLEVSFL